MKTQLELIQNNVVLAPYTSWLVGGPAEFFATPENLGELQNVMRWAHEHKLPLTILGGGSNVLIADSGIKGLVICLKKLTGITTVESDSELRLEAWAGSSKSELLKIFLKYKLAPALFLAGLPGDIGGGVVMNAGVAEAFTPREFGEIVEWVEVMDLQDTKLSIKKYSHDDIKWTYRHSSGWGNGIVTRVGIKWPMRPQEEILQQVREANRLRLSKQPLDKPSCGSVFVNPVGNKAAQLIDSCGLKGFQIGDAQVSIKHANFIVNLGSATAAQILAVIQHVQNVVFEKKAVKLQTEVIRLGKFE